MQGASPEVLPQCKVQAWLMQLPPAVGLHQLQPQPQVHACKGTRLLQNIKMHKNQVLGANKAAPLFLSRPALAFISQQCGGQMQLLHALRQAPIFPSLDPKADRSLISSFASAAAAAAQVGSLPAGCMKSTNRACAWRKQL